MKKILLASHGKLAFGLKNTLEMFIGESDDITAVSAYLDDSDDYLKTIETFINQGEEEKIIFTDILGGSVNQQVMKLLMEMHKEIMVITSMNLAIVLSIALCEEKITPTLADGLLVECSPMRMEFKKTESEMIDTIDDFLSGD